MYNGSGTRYLNYYGPPRTITTVPFSSIIHNGTDQNIALPDIRDKVVFIGVSDVGSFTPGDTFRTVFTTGEGRDLSGVEIAATAFANLLDGRDLKPLAPVLSILLVGVFGLIAALSCYVLGPVDGGARGPEPRRGLSRRRILVVHQRRDLVSRSSSRSASRFPSPSSAP
jgi:adenylate cyclase